jgi:hypothetical protein
MALGESVVNLLWEAIISSLPKANVNFSDIKVLIGEPRVDSGKEIKRQLGILGVRKIRVMGDFDMVKNSVANDEADLCLCNMQTQTNAPWNMMRGVREQ